MSKKFINLLFFFCITYVYKIGLKNARKLKENYAHATKKYADKYDSIELTNEISNAAPSILNGP